MLTPGTRLGHFEVLSPVGAGGMGEVYRARDLHLDRDVAIKVLPTVVAGDPDRLARFEREAKALARLSHPNILPIFEFGTDEGTTFAVTELLEGETLRERIRRGALPLRNAVDIGAQIATGLAAAHEKGIVHRDLKPENVFVVRDGTVKILDFGLARILAPAASQAETLAGEAGATAPGAVVGTIGYMSPEQVCGQVVDARSDIFALGTVLYEMLSGVRPFRGETPTEELKAVLSTDPPPLVGPNPPIPVEVGRLVTRCLDKRPSHRFQSAGDLAHDMMAMVAGSEAAAPQPPRSPLAVPRGPWVVIGVAIVTALVVGLDIGELRSRLGGAPRTDPIRSLAVLPLDNLSGDPEQEFFADGMTEALIADLAKIGTLKVISRTSVMRFKGTTRSLPEIAAELNVDAVIEGSVLRSGDRVRITAQLIDGASDHHLWADSFERAISDVLSLQSEIARAVASQVRVVLTPAEEGRLAAGRPVDAEAYEAYLMGHYHLRKQTTEGARKARQYFEEAVAKDPDSALALTGLVAFYVDFGSQYLPLDELRALAEAAAARALTLDDTLAEAHLALGNVRLWLQWNWSEAERELTRAIELNPGLAEAHHGYAHYLWMMGHDSEGLAESERYIELDPLAPRPRECLGWQLLLSRQYERATASYEKTLELDPEYYFAHVGLGNVLTLQGRLEEARTQYGTAQKISTETFSFAAVSLAHLEAVAGNRSAAEEILLRIDTEDNDFLPTGRAMVYAALGDADEAFLWLERAYSVKDQLLPDLDRHPFFDPLRDDPRFPDLLRRMGIPRT